MKKHFENLMVIGRPASGKSEFFDFIRNKISDEKRLSDLHIAPFDEIDDFPWIYEKFIEDNIWESCGYPRRYSVPVGEKIYNTSDYSLYDFMIGKFNEVIRKKYLSDPSYYERRTLLVEFARGMKDAYKRAFALMGSDVLERSAILNVHVSFEESIRRNYARASEKDEQGVLHHTVPKDVIEGYYRDNDWLELTDNKESGYLTLNGVKVPFVTMNNEPELKPSPELEQRYISALNKLWDLRSK